MSVPQAARDVVEVSQRIPQELVVKVADGPCDESDQQQRVVAVVGQAWENELGQVTVPRACRIWTSMNARRSRNSRERTKTRRWCNKTPRRRNCRPRHERADARHRVLCGMDEEHQCTTVAGGVDNDIGG